jgi:hypothetical protein
VTILAALAVLAGCSAPGASGKGAAAGPLVGRTDWSQWERADGWGAAFASTREPDAGAVRQVSSAVVQQNARFVLLGGEWSAESQREMPQVRAVMQAAGIGPEHIQIIAVDQDLSEPTGTAQSLGVTGLPTLVVYRNGFEAGRIVGKPRVSWEEDLRAVLQAR